LFKLYFERLQLKQAFTALHDCANLLLSLVGEKIGILGSLRLCLGVAMFEKEAPRLGSARLDAGD